MLNEREEPVERVLGLCKQSSSDEEHIGLVYQYDFVPGTNDRVKNSFCWTDLREEDLVMDLAYMDDGTEFYCKRTPVKKIPVMGTFHGYPVRKIENSGY